MCEVVDIFRGKCTYESNWAIWVPKWKHIGRGTMDCNPETSAMAHIVLFFFVVPLGFFF